MRAPVLVLALGLLGCPAFRGGGDDDAGDGCPADLPAPSSACLADQCGNDLGVGMPCSPEGGECDQNGFSGAYLCTANFSDTDLWFCTLPCVVDEQCGEGARCARDPDNPAAGAGCFPRVCDGDAGPADAGA